MALSPKNVLDLAKATQNVWKRGTWVDISMPFQKYFFARLLKGKGQGKMRKMPQSGGPQCEFEIRVDNVDTFRLTGFYAIDVLSDKNVLDSGIIDWSLQDTHYILDDRMPKWQSSPEKIIDLVKVKEQGLYNDFFNGMEPLMWTAPSSSALDPMPPAGIPFWLQQCSASDPAAFGFYGGDPAGWSAGAGGVSTGTYENWKNGTYRYALVSKEDMIEKTVQAFDYCHFEAPQPFPNTVAEKPNWGLYSVYSVIQELRRLSDVSNENHGDDVAKWMNSVSIRGVPVEWVPALDNSKSEAYVTNRPVYGVNWATLHYFFKTGEAMVRHPMIRLGNSYRTYKRYLSNAGQIVCEDRRRNFVGYDSTV